MGATLRGCLHKIILAGFLIVALLGGSDAYAQDPVNPGDALARKIASVTANAIYNLDREQLVAVLEGFLDEKPEIKALIIRESIENEHLLGFYREDGRAVYNEPIPGELLELTPFSANATFEGEVIGSITIYLADRKALKLSVWEQDWIRENPVIRVSNESAWPPFNFAKDGEPQGFSIDFMNLVAQKAGLKVEYVTGPTWNDYLGLMKSGDLDVMLNIVRTPERQKYMLFTPPYANNPNTILSRKGNTYRKLDELFGKTVSIPKGFFYEEILKRDFPQINILTVDDTLESMKAVSFGNADAAFGELAVFRHLIDENLMTDLAISGEVKLGDPEYAFLNMATRTDLPELVSILTNGILSVTREERQAIQEKWFATAQPFSTGMDSEELVLPEVEKFDQTGFIIKFVALFFGLILGTLFIVWLARGRPTELTIRETLFLISFVFAGLIVAIGTLTTMLLDSESKQTDVETHKYQSLKLALELKQSSDDLTRFARTFAVTGDPVYEKYFHAILDIRSGKQPHPLNYTHSYWDHIAGGSVTLDQHGETYSIEESMSELGLSQAEQDKLLSAKNESDALVDLEATAINAIHGRFRDADGNFTVKGEPDLELARTLLHGKAYHEAKSRIMKPIDDFFQLLEARTTNELNLLRHRNHAIIIGITFLIFLTIGFSVYVFFLLKRRVISPLSELVAGAEIISQGDYSHQLAVATDDEVGNLASAFNHMSLSIEERNRELKEAFFVITSSIEYASRIQRSILPDDSILSAVTKDHFVLWEPRDIVGGDVYWHGAWGDGCLIVLADCTGHGVPGAFMSLISIGALERAMSEIEGGNLAKLISRVHQYIQVTLGQHYEGGHPLSQLRRTP